LAAEERPWEESAAAASEVAAAEVAEVLALATFVTAAPEVADEDWDVDDAVVAAAVVEVERVVLVELVGGTSEVDTEVDVGASVVVGAGVGVDVSVVVTPGTPGGSVAAAVQSQLLSLPQRSASRLLAHIATAELETVGAYPGGQAALAQSLMALLKSGTRHKQFRSEAPQAKVPALFMALL
jgi:hypothetical protein